MKRTIKQNIYGNWVGYTGRSRAEEFGNDEVAAGYWLLTGIVDFNECYSDEWYPKSKQAVKDSYKSNWLAKRKQPTSTPAWRYDAPINPFFRGAERPRLGEDY
jgi:hypothetical protein